jgi:hypothetical protein
MPERHRRGTGKSYGARCVAIVKRARKSYYANLGGH